MNLIGSIVDVEYHVSVLPNELRLVYRPDLLDREPCRNSFQSKFHIIVPYSFVKYYVRYKSSKFPDGIVDCVDHDPNCDMMVPDIVLQKLNYFRIPFGNQVRT